MLDNPIHLLSYWKNLLFIWKNRLTEYTIRILITSLWYLQTLLDWVMSCSWEFTRNCEKLKEGRHVKYWFDSSDRNYQIIYWLIDWLVFNVQRAIFQLYSGREHLKILNHEYCVISWYPSEFVCSFSKIISKQQNKVAKHMWWTITYRGRRDRDRTTTYAICAYHHWSAQEEVYSIMC